MEQLTLPVDPPFPTAETSNGLFHDRTRRLARQGVAPNDHHTSPYRHLRGFGTARTPSTATPVRWQRSRPFNLMPAPVLRFEPGRPDSPLRLTGQVFLVIGILSAALASWYLWGTGILTAGEQSRLSNEFQERLLATSDVTALPLGEEAADAASDITVPVAWDDPVIQISPAAAELEAIPDLADVIPEAAPLPGEAVGRIVIPKADVDWIVVEGVTPEDLRNGPGHIRGSAMPGQVGNTVISGHRTTNGAPFYDLDQLVRGDAISVESLTGTHTYEVVETRIVAPTDTWVATQWEGSWLTLTTCTPRFSSSSRLIVFARLIDGPNAEAIHARYGLPVAIPGA